MNIQTLILAHATREQLAARLAASAAVRVDVDCFYFGCVGGPGHFFHGPGGTTKLRATEEVVTALFKGIDGKLCWNSPRADRDRYDYRDETEGRAFITHSGGWTALAFWDRSVDRRGACNSAFFVQGTLTFAQIVRVARHRWPKLWARFAFPVVEVDARGREVEEGTAT